MKALKLFAGPKAFDHIQRNGLRAEHIGVIPGAAGGPKGLILGPLDRFIFGEWLPQSDCLGCFALRMRVYTQERGIAGSKTAGTSRQATRSNVPPRGRGR